MHRMTMTAALAAILAASMPMAFAAETGASATTTRSSVMATQLQPGQIRATDMRGSNVYDSQSNKIASVKDIVLDRDGRIAEVVLDVDGKYVAVGMQDLRITMANNKPHIAIGVTKDQLKSAQAFDLDIKPATTGSSAPPVGIPPATMPPANRSH